MLPPISAQPTAPSSSFLDALWQRGLLAVLAVLSLAALPLAVSAAEEAPKGGGTVAEADDATPEGHDSEAWMAYIAEPLNAEPIDMTESQARLIVAQQALVPAIDRTLHYLMTELDDRGKILLEAEHDAWDLHHRAQARLEASPQHATNFAHVVHGMSLIESYCRRIDQLETWLANAQQADGEVHVHE